MFQQYDNLSKPIEEEDFEEQHSSQYYKLVFLNEYVKLDSRDSDMRDNQRAFIIRDTSIVPTKMITRLTEEDAAKFCWHMYRYLRSIADIMLPASVTLDILRVAGRYYNRTPYDSVSSFEFYSMSVLVN